MTEPLFAKLRELEKLEPAHRNREMPYALYNARHKLFAALDLMEDVLKEICEDTGHDFVMSQYVSKATLDRDKGIALDDAYNTAYDALAKVREMGNGS